MTYVLYTKRNRFTLYVCNCTGTTINTSTYNGGSRICKRGAKFERLRREYRGAEGVEGVGFGEGYLPNGEESGEGAWPLPRKSFDFESKNGEF